MRTHVWRFAAVAGALAGAGYLLLDGELAREAVWRLTLLGACAGIVVGVRINPPARKHPWWLLLAALGLLAVINLLTYPAWVTPWAEGLASPLSMLAFPLIGVAALAIFRLQAPGGDRESAIDGVIVMVAMATVLTGTVYHPDNLAPGVPLADVLLNTVVAPLMMAAVLAANFRLLFIGTARIPAAWIVVGATTSGLFGNIMRALTTSQGTYERGTWSDLFILLAYAGIGIAALHPSSPRLTQPAETRHSRFTNARLTVLGLALLAAPATLLSQGGGSIPTLPVLASVLVSLLVLLRLSQLVVDRERSRRQLHQRAERQEALAQLGLRALDDHGLPALFDRATDSIHELLSPCSAVVVGEAPADGPSVVVLPLAHGGPHLVGERRDTWNAEDVAFLQAVANVLAGALDRHATQELLRQQAVYDALTGLPNRVLILDRLEQELASCHRTGSEIVVMFIDLDGFKQVNDDHGHRAGDELLIGVAQRLRSTVRAADTVGRLAGDEFVVMGEHTELGELRQLADRVVHALGQPFDVVGGETGVGASIGVVVAGAAATDAERVLAHADAAMYQAKRRPGGAVEVYDEQLGDERRRRRQLEKDLAAALVRDDESELRLVYQPIVLTAAPGLVQVVGAEALLRWNHPLHGPCSPGVFIPIAETSDLIVRLGDRVIADACQQLARWEPYLTAQRSFTLYVNLASRQLADPQLPARVAAALAETGVEPARLGFEVAETAMLDDNAIAVATELRGLGVRLALDDFGTGYTSIAHLKRLPLDLIKLDGSLVVGAAARAKDEAIVRAIVAVATELGIDVLAEQVATSEQGRLMQRLGCELMQGYLFAKPSPPDDIAVPGGLKLAFPVPSGA